jgi:hypothetical protein
VHPCGGSGAPPPVHPCGGGGPLDLLGPGSGSSIPASFPDPLLIPVTWATSGSVIGDILWFLSSVVSCHCCTHSILPLQSALYLRILLKPQPQLIW